MSGYEALRRDPGNRQAFAQWYRETYPELYRSALRVTGGQRSLAEDLCHDAILSFFARAAVSKIESPSGAVKYLRKAVANLHIDYLRRKRWETPMETVPEMAQEAAELEATAAQEGYTRLLSRLDEDEQELLGLMLMGESLSGIAGALGISYSNAGVRSHRIRKKINELMESGNFGVKKIRLARLNSVGSGRESKRNG